MEYLAAVRSAVLAVLRTLPSGFSYWPQLPDFRLRWPPASWDIICVYVNLTGNGSVVSNGIQCGRISLLHSTGYEFCQHLSHDPITANLVGISPKATVAYRIILMWLVATSRLTFTKFQPDLAKGCFYYNLLNRITGLCKGSSQSTFALITILIFMKILYVVIAGVTTSAYYGTQSEPIYK